MNAGTIRKLAADRCVAELEAAAEAIIDREEEIWPIDGEDLGERLTHVLLAARIRRRVDAGESEKDAFRAEMGAVRTTLKND